MKRHWQHLNEQTTKPQTGKHQCNNIYNYILYYIVIYSKKGVNSFGSENKKHRQLMKSPGATLTPNFHGIYV